MAFSSQAWTGRPPHAGTPVDLLNRRIHSLLYPSYECEQCVGQEEWRGCYCAYYGATSPGQGPGSIRAWLRNLFIRIGEARLTEFDG